MYLLSTYCGSVSAFFKAAKKQRFVVSWQNLSKKKMTVELAWQLHYSNNFSKKKKSVVEFILGCLH